jgi:hypothetical protein
MAADPPAQVGWSWHHRLAARTGRRAHRRRRDRHAHRVCRFGQIEDADEVSEVEVRASWTPLPDADGAMDLGVHLLAWCDLLCATAGLPRLG